MHKRFAKIIVALFILFTSSVSLSANAALYVYEGNESGEVIIDTDDVEVLVQKEKLTFEVPEFSDYFKDLASLEEYPSKLSVEYAFYNSGDEDLNLRLMFPLGNIPDSLNVKDLDFDSYNVSLDGEKIAKSLRFSYDREPNVFEREQDLSHLGDDYFENELYDLNKDTKVRIYSFELTLDDEADAYIMTSSKGSLFLSNDLSSFSKDQDRLEFGFARDLKDVQLAVIGDEDLDFNWTFKKLDEKTDGKAALKELKEMDLEEFALSLKIDPNINDRDWFNYFLSYIGRSVDAYEKSAAYIELNTYEYESCAMWWFEYEIAIKKGETVVNTIEAPLFPRINQEYEPTLYEYSYLLSPAKVWQDLESLEIKINTPYYLIEDDFGFKKDSDGYSLELDGLPEGELGFKLAESTELAKVDHGYHKTFETYLFTIFFIIIAIIALAFVLVYKKIRKHK